MGQLNLLRMMNDVEPLAAMNTSFVLVQSLLLGGSSGRPSEPGLSERYLQHFRSPLANATPPLAAPDARHPDDEAPDWASVGVAPADDHLLMPEWAYQVAAAYLVVICVLGVVMNAMVVVVILNDPQVGAREPSVLVSLFFPPFNERRRITRHPSLHPGASNENSSNVHSVRVAYSTRTLHSATSDAFLTLHFTV